MIKRIVTGVLENDVGEILLLHRRKERDTHGGLWSFVSGHIEKGETSEEALERELEEEVGVDSFEVVEKVEWMDNVSHLDYDFEVHLFRCLVDEQEVEVDDYEHDNHAWIKPEDIYNYSVFEGIIVNLEKLGYDI